MFDRNKVDLKYVAHLLTSCAGGDCNNCIYKGTDNDFMGCRDKLVTYTGSLLRDVVERWNDDGK